jgi:hypothetical protein
LVRAAKPKPKDLALLPVYSFKDYKPSPAIVYTRHEEETEDLLGALKG